MKIDGKIVQKPYIKQGQCSEILAITKTGKIVLIKSYRPEIDDYVYELPAGSLKKSEDPKITAKRELEEETGYVAKKIKFLFSGYPLLGYSNCKLYFFLASDLDKKKQELEADEYIKVREFTLNEVLRLLRKGKIKDLCVLSALHYFYYVMNKGKKTISYADVK